MIELKQVTIQAGSFSIRNLTMSIPSGSYTVLMGPSGSGKTTVLESILGLRPVPSGEVWINGANVTYRPVQHRGIGYVPQDIGLFCTMSVRENLSFAPRLRRWRPSEVGRRVDELATILGIGHLLDRPAADLSGGEAQRVAIGRAIAVEPTVLLLDEPLSALDDANRQQMWKLLSALHQRMRTTILHVTHHREDADVLATHRLSMP